MKTVTLAFVAQLVEHLTVNQKVAGSKPAESVIHFSKKWSKIYINFILYIFYFVYIFHLLTVSSETLGRTPISWQTLQC